MFRRLRLLHVSSLHRHSSPPFAFLLPSHSFRPCALVTNDFLSHSFRISLRNPAAAAAAARGSGCSRGRCVEAAMAEAATHPHTPHLFVYGTLLAEEVLQVLIKRVPRRVDAFVENFQRYSLRGLVYPAAVPAEGKILTGKILFDLTDDELAKLDEFEGIEYIKVVVEPRPLSDPKSDGASGIIQAFMYIWEHSTDQKLFGEWDYEEWRRLHLKNYIAMCQNLISEIDDL